MEIIKIKCIGLFNKFNNKKLGYAYILVKLWIFSTQTKVSNTLSTIRLTWLNSFLLLKTRSLQNFEGGENRQPWSMMNCVFIDFIFYAISVHTSLATQDIHILSQGIFDGLDDFTMFSLQINPLFIYDQLSRWRCVSAQGPGGVQEVTAAAVQVNCEAESP